MLLPLYCEKNLDFHENMYYELWQSRQCNVFFAGDSHVNMTSSADVGDT